MPTQRGDDVGLDHSHLPAGPVPGTVRLRHREDLETLDLAGGVRRRAYEDAVVETLARGRDEWWLPAYCEACLAGVAVSGTWYAADQDRPNLRETLVCPRCELNARQRFTAGLLRAVEPLLPAALPFYLYEQVTPLFRWASRELTREVVGSEYLGHDRVGGEIVDGLRHEDAAALSFADASLAGIVSTDVYEHVPDIEVALAEAARVLAPGGWLLFTVPFHAERDTTLTRALLVDGVPHHLMEPQYHGNPVSDQGSLVFYDHAWDLLGRCQDAGFDDAYAVGYWDAHLGYLGDGLQLLFVATKVPLD